MLFHVAQLKLKAFSLWMSCTLQFRHAALDTIHGVKFKRTQAAIVIVAIAVPNDEE